MKFTPTFAATAVLVLSASCCSLLPIDWLNDPPGDEQRSSLSRDLTPNSSPESLTVVVSGNTQFAVDFYRKVASTDDENLFFSPYSISLALAMTYAGARGNTEAQMAEVLHFLDQASLHPAINEIDLKLRGGDQDSAQVADEFVLDIVNSIWGQKDYSFLPGFLDVLAVSYGAGVYRVDFQNHPEQYRIDINAWVSRKTRNRIGDLIPQGAIDSLTRLVLTNAIYFKADWLDPFEKEDTVDGPFHRIDGDSIDVPLMNQSGFFAYCEQADFFQAIELPYKGKQVSMMIILPHNGRFADVQRDLGPELLETIDDSLEDRSVHLTLPKTSFEWGTSVKAALSALGMVDAFTPSADFSGIDGTWGLYLTDVIHKAFVAIDEEGTEAAAATAAIIAPTSVLVEDVRMLVDRPFIFLIRHNETGVILFLGHVLDPSEA